MDKGKSAFESAGLLYDIRPMPAPRILIVEDEAIHRQTLEMYLEELEYQVCGVASDYTSALAIYKKGDADLVLMDINIEGERDGIELAKAIQRIEPVPIIFITGFKDREVFERALKTKPNAYLIKPIDKDNLEKSIELAFAQFTATEGSANGTALIKNAWFVKQKGKLTKVLPEDVFYLEADGNYTDIHTATERFTIRKQIKDFENMLVRGNCFARIHRKYLVNVDKITDIRSDTNEVFAGSVSLPLGRSYKESFMRSLNILE